MTIHDEIKDLVYYSDYSYEEAKKIFLNSFWGARMELGRNIRLCNKAIFIDIWKTYNKIKSKFNRLNKATRGTI